MNMRPVRQALLMGAVLGALAWVPAFAESTDSATFEGWANDVAVKNNGYISRDIYMNEMGRRWDTMPNHRSTRDSYLSDLRTQWDQLDPDNRGLTPAQVSKLTGKVDSPTESMPKAGGGVQPGNMGPGSSKGQ